AGPARRGRPPRPPGRGAELGPGRAREDRRCPPWATEEHPHAAGDPRHRGRRLQAGQLVRRPSVHRPRLLQDFAGRPADPGRDPRDRSRRLSRSRLLGTSPCPRLRPGLHPMKTRKVRAQPPPAAQVPRTTARRQVVFDPEGPFTFVVLRPLSDLFLWLWRLERRTEFLYRPQFDRWCRPALFSWAQAWQNSRRPDQHLPLVQETPL